MSRLLRPLLVLVLLLVAGQAWGDLRKLDPLARRTYERLTSGAPAPGAAAATAEGELDVFIVGPVSRAELEAAGARVRTALPGVFTADLPLDAVERVAALALVDRVEAATFDEATNDSSTLVTGARALRGAGPDFTGLNGQGVIVGIVDSGTDWRHEDFRNPDGSTRFLAIWDRTDMSGSPPSMVSGLPYTTGSEWTQANIDNALTGGTPVPGRDTNFHGTHVLGTAAGDGSMTGTGSAPAFTYAGMAPKAHLMAARASTTGSFSSTAVVDCASWLVDRAALFGLPCVVNISIGAQSGPHDGTHASELAYDALSGPGRIIVLSAGNDRGAALHGEAYAGSANNYCTMAFSGTSTSSRQVVVYGYYNATENLNLTVTAPGGAVVGPVALGGTASASTANGNVYVENGYTLTSLGHRFVYLEFTATGTVINGTWRFTFTPVVLGPANGEVDLWRVLTTNTTADFVVGNTPDRELISARATGYQTLAAAAWTDKVRWVSCNGSGYGYTGRVPPGNLAPFSSPGPSRDGRQKPDIAAPGSVILSSQSQDPTAPACGSGILPGLVHSRNQGTSMAAPHVAGAVALLMQKYGAITPAFARSMLAQRAVVDGYTGAAWNKDWGVGKLHLGDLVDPAVAVTSPNGGETLISGTVAPLTWSATDAGGVTAVDLLLSWSGAAGPFTPLATDLANTGTYAWDVALPPGMGCLLTDCWLKVVARDAQGNTGADVSDAAFTLMDLATPTLLSRFTALAVGTGIELRWQFSEPGSVRDVAVERSGGAEGPWAAVAVERREEAGAQVALDRGAQAGATYWYRISGLVGGSRLTFGPIAATAGEVIREVALGRPVPNPTSGGTQTEFALPQAARVSLGVFDMQGRRVATLVDGLLPAGRHQASWNGASEGRRVPAGIYFLRLRGQGVDLSRRLVVTR